MASKSKKIYVIPHTHWDREWYLTFEQFRFRLMTGIESILESLESGQLDSFFFDGQTVVLEDLKQTIDEQTWNDLKENIGNGKIEVGPWYVLPDEFLISHESLIRNLQFGSKMAENLGSWAGLGYLPDTFGHISQLPAVFKSMGLKQALLFRGTNTKSAYVEWIGADGTSINTIILPLFDGYYHPWLNENDYWERAVDFIKKMGPYEMDNQILLMAGADHMIPHKELNHRLTILNNNESNLSFKTVTFKKYLERLKKVSPEEQIHGEQRSSSKAYILPGVLSSRNYLKRANQQAEDFLSGIMEPLSVFAPNHLDRMEYEEYLWKTLLKNHAHDSICGCSIDEVHKDNEQRFRAVLDGVKAYVTNALSGICSDNPEEFNDKLYLFSLVPNNRELLNIETTIFVPEKDDKGSITLLNAGNPLIFDLISRVKTEGFYSRNEKAPNWNSGFNYTVIFSIQGDGFSLKEITIKPVEADILYKAYSNTNRMIENEYYRVSAEADGSLTIVDKKVNKIWNDMHIISSSIDEGDSYNYCAPQNDYISRAQWNGHCESILGNSYSQLKVSYNLQSPYSKNDRRLIESPLSVRIRLYNNGSPIEISTELENKSKDRIIRLNFPIETKEYISYGDTAFDYVARNEKSKKPLYAAPAKEDSSGIFSSLSSIYSGGLTVNHLGINEYEISDWSFGQKQLSCTLLRATSHLSIRELNSRGGGAGPVIETPEGQCPGKHNWLYWLSFGEKDRGPGLSKSLRTGYSVFQGKRFKGEDFILKLDNEILTVTALKRTSPNEILLRLFNPSENCQSLNFSSNRKLTISEENLKGDVAGIFERTAIQPKEILTLRINYS
ncbi:MAG: glycosyl hydrolase-related protein [Spirochaetaceae bacterium]|nr:glycosyl hydrolase-related protein [Spirochaetaceae bacterium]